MAVTRDETGFSLQYFQRALLLVVVWDYGACPRLHRWQEHISYTHPAATGDMPTYQIRTPTTALPQGVVMAASPGTLHSPQQLAEEATRKRELRLMKNREAARECRRKKKEYVKCLENRVAVLENQNKTLIEELKALKDLYCHKAE
uniref:cAMP-responsive element modulator isoform X4 n=1 Tax=Pogona vitticeps TaxID=103695 RepID=A0ABM5GMZ0_9SAUR